MKPIEFKQMNTTLQIPHGFTDDQCGPLPALRHDNGIISCWKMSWRERIKVLFTGVVWFDVMDYSQPPIWLGVDSPFGKEE